MVTPFDNLKKYSVILASGSPRRKELLSAIGIDYEVKVIKGIDESYPTDMDAVEIPQFISRQKAAAYKKDMSGNELIITADTVVSVENKILGKPQGRSRKNVESSFGQETPSDNWSNSLVKGTGRNFRSCQSCNHSTTV